MSTLSEKIAPVIFESMLDRAQARMSEYLPPEAKRGVLIAGRDMLTAAGHFPGAPEPAGWLMPREHGYWVGEVADFEKPSADGERMLRARQFGQFWMPERSIKVERGYQQLRQVQALVFAFENAPIWTRERAAAMRLVEHCDPFPASPVAGFWLPLFECSFNPPRYLSRGRRQVKT